MAENYHHGVRVFELNDGIRPIRTIATAVQGLVATADDADPLVFPENVPVLLTNTQAAVAKAGTKGTLRKALQAMANQANSVCVVVRVASAVDEATQTANVIGTVTAEGKYGRPDIIPEQEFIFSGLKPQIEDIVWLGTNITHTINDTGFTTSVELEVQLPNADDVSTLFEARDPEQDKAARKIRTGKKYAEYTGVIVYYQEKGKTNTLTSGDQTNPLKLTHLYVSKATATVALKREQARIDRAKTGK